MQVFDVHHHVGSLRDVSYDVPLEERVASHVGALDRHGIDRGAAMPAPTYPNPDGIADTRAVNDDMATIKREHGDRFPVAFGTVEPWYGERGLEEVDRAMEELDLDGMMWHNRWQPMAVDGEMMQRLVGRVVDHDGIVVLHAHGEAELTSPWRVLRVAESFPGGTFVVLDVFSSTVQTEMVPKLADKFDLGNVWFDISLPHNLPRQMRTFTEAISTDRLLFGTDTYTEREEPFTALPIQQFEATDLDEEERRAVLYGNAAEVFGLE